MRMEQLGEFGLIDRIRRTLPEPGPDVIVGIGDDVAVVRATTDRVWLATCDVQVQGTHFLIDEVVPRNLGRKALAINLSDIAAAGGSPRFALVSLGLPADLAVDFVDDLYEGLRAQGAIFNTEIVGGNISRSRLGLFIDLFLLGEAPRENLVLRSGAHPGDKILVTGTLGDAAAGLALLMNPALKTSEAYAGTARMRYNLPTPRVREGALIGASHLATSMLDISDGLASDLGHICEKSTVGARVIAAELPITEDNRTLSTAANGNPWHLGVFGGEDYELLFTAAPEKARVLAASIIQETGTPVSIIGDILPANQGGKLVLPDGSTVPLTTGGWDHFKS